MPTRRPYSWEKKEDHTPKAGGQKVKNRVGTSAGHIGPRSWLGPLWWKGHRPRVRPKREPKGAKRASSCRSLTCLEQTQWKCWARLLRTARNYSSSDFPVQEQEACFQCASLQDVCTPPSLLYIATPAWSGSHGEVANPTCDGECVTPFKCIVKKFHVGMSTSLDASSLRCLSLFVKDLEPGGSATFCFLIV